MPASDRGAVIAPTARVLVLWGSHLPSTPTGAWGTRDGLPMVVTSFRTDIAPSTVATIINNLRWDDPDFPVTVLD